MNKGLCKDIYSGLYRIWVALYFSFFFFLVLSIVASILYQYFGYYPEETHHDGLLTDQKQAEGIPVAEQVEIEMKLNGMHNNKSVEVAGGGAGAGMGELESDPSNNGDIPIIAASQIRY